MNCGTVSGTLYTSELILCSTICVQSAMRYYIHMYPYFLFATNPFGQPLTSPTVQVRDKRPTHTQNARTIFAQKRVEKRVLEHAFARKCTHLMCVFPFVIHSHQWHTSPSSLNKRQDKRQFLQTLLKIFPPTNKQPISFWPCAWC